MKQVWRLLSAANAGEMEQKVNQAVSEGYEPFGDLQVVAGAYPDCGYFYQWVMGHYQETEGTSVVASAYFVTKGSEA